MSDTSPRYSFSDDQRPAEKDSESRRDELLLKEPNSDFEFCIIDQEASSADELFEDGVIVPLQLRRCSIDSNISNKQDLGRFKSKLRSSNSRDESAAKAASFWGVPRSKSLQCAIEKGESLSAARLARSNSTGSMPYLKAKPTKSGLCRQQNTSAYTQKGTLRNGVWFSPVLNIPTPFIAKGTTLLGLGSFLRSSKEKKNKK